MKKPIKLLFLFTAFTLLFSCDCYHEELSMIPEQDFVAPRTMGELKELIQDDPLTADHNLMVREAFVTFLEQKGGISSESLESSPSKPEETFLWVISSATDKASETYYKSMIASYPELEGMSIEQQLELLFGVKLSDIEEANQRFGNDQLDLSEEMNYLFPNSGNARGICDSLVDATMSIMTATFYAILNNDMETAMILSLSLRFATAAARMCLSIFG